MLELLLSSVHNRDSVDLGGLATLRCYYMRTAIVLSGLAYIEVVTLTNNIAQGHSEYI